MHANSLTSEISVISPTKNQGKPVQPSAITLHPATCHKARVQCSSWGWRGSNLPLGKVLFFQLLVTGSCVITPFNPELLYNRNVGVGHVSHNFDLVLRLPTGHIDIDASIYFSILQEGVR